MIDEVGKDIFKELAKEGRDIYHKRLVGYRQQQPPSKDAHHQNTLKVARKSISSEVNEINLSTTKASVHTKNDDSTKQKSLLLSTHNNPPEDLFSLDDMDLEPIPLFYDSSKTEGSSYGYDTRSMSEDNGTPPTRMNICLLDDMDIEPLPALNDSSKTGESSYDCARYMPEEDSDKSITADVNLAAATEIVYPSFPSSEQEMQLVTELIFVASTNQIAKVERLIEQISPNCGDYDHRTALHVAASEGQLEAAKTLVSHGAHINIADRWGDTPLDSAALNGNHDVGTYLLDNGGIYGPKKHITTHRLIQAVSDQDIDTVRSILACGFDPNVGDYDHRTPLHIAVAVKDVDIAKLLIKHGADVNAIDRFGGTPKTETEKMRNKTVAQFVELIRGVEQESNSDKSTSSVGKRRSISASPMEDAKRVSFNLVAPASPESEHSKMNHVNSRDTISTKPGLQLFPPPLTHCCPQDL